MRVDLDHWFKLPKDHPNAGQVVEIPMQSFHIRVGERSMLVDVPAHDFPGEHKQYQAPGRGEKSLLEQLAAAGIQPEEVTDVIITHAHFDHYNALSVPDGDGYAPAYPKARHYLGIGDFNPDDFKELEEHTFGMLNKLGMLFLVDQAIDLEDQLAIIPIPGETPGHQMLMLATEQLHAYFVGDLYHHTLEFDDPDMNVYWVSEQMPVSKGMVAKTAMEYNAEVYFTHMLGAHKVELEGEQMVWKSQQS